jgi:hypothetical protein
MRIGDIDTGIAILATLGNVTTTPIGKNAIEAILLSSNPSRGEKT